MLDYSKERLKNGDELLKTRQKRAQPENYRLQNLNTVEHCKHLGAITD